MEQQKVTFSIALYLYNKYNTIEKLLYMYVNKLDTSVQLLQCTEFKY